MSVDVKLLEFDYFRDPLALLSDLFYNHNDYEDYDDSDEDSTCVYSYRYNIQACFGLFSFRCNAIRSFTHFIKTFIFFILRKWVTFNFREILITWSYERGYDAIIIECKLCHNGTIGS